MVLSEAFDILEMYYLTIYDYSSDSNMADFDLDVALTKQKLEKIVDKRAVGNEDIDFLKSLLDEEDLGKSVEEAIKYIIEGY